MSTECSRSAHGHQPRDPERPADARADTRSEGVFVAGLAQAAMSLNLANLELVPNSARLRGNWRRRNCTNQTRALIGVQPAATPSERVTSASGAPPQRCGRIRRNAEPVAGTSCRRSSRKRV